MDVKRNLSDADTFAIAKCYKLRKAHCFKIHIFNLISISKSYENFHYHSKVDNQKEVTLTNLYNLSMANERESTIGQSHKDGIIQLQIAKVSQMRSV